MGLNLNSSHQAQTEIFSLHNAARPSVPPRLCDQLHSCPWFLRMPCPGRWEGALLEGWFSFLPSQTSLKWLSCCCHGNGVWSHRRRNMCGIQLLPGVGRREASFYPVRIPTGGRDVRFKMGRQGKEQYGSKPQPRNCVWELIWIDPLPLNWLKTLEFKILHAWLFSIYFPLLFNTVTLWTFFFFPEKGAATSPCLGCIWNQGL